MKKNTFLVVIAGLFLVFLLTVFFTNKASPTGNAVAEGTCVQSDANADMYVQGEVKKSQNGSASDYCEKGKLAETFCKNGYLNVEVIPCSDSGGSCTSGACGKKSGESASCTDSDDGANFYAKGTVTDTVGKSLSHTDFCPQQFGTTLLEFYCSVDNTAAFVTITCPSGTVCVNGACVKNPSCIDSDYGMDIYNAGTAVGFKSTKDDQTEKEKKEKKGEAKPAYENGAYSDYCTGQQTVVEYYCKDSGLVGSTTMSCSGGDNCVDGRCK